VQAGWEQPGSSLQQGPYKYISAGGCEAGPQERAVLGENNQQQVQDSQQQ
jgi:hypothetical protein